jgi:putative DNA primase/helicase
MPWGEIKPLSLSMLTVGESGERKSGVDDLVLGAAKAQEREEMSAHEEAVSQYEAELSAWKKAAEQAGKRASGKDKGAKDDYLKAADEVGPPPLAPVFPLRFVSDPTVEGLYKLLAIGQPSVALFSDEGGLLIGGHALNSDNALKTLARWCKLWDGSPYDRVRGGDGSGILYGRRMALHQLAQPEVMTTLLSDSMANGQGFLARCLVAWPETTIGERHIERYEWGGNRPEIKRLFGKLKALLETLPCIESNG